MGKAVVYPLLENVEAATLAVEGEIIGPHMEHGYCRVNSNPQMFVEFFSG